MEIVVEYLPRVYLATFLEETGLEIKIREQQNFEGEVYYAASFSPCLHSRWWTGNSVSVKAAQGTGRTPRSSLMDLLIKTSGRELYEKGKEEDKIQIPYFKDTIKGLPVRD